MLHGIDPDEGAGSAQTGLAVDSDGAFVGFTVLEELGNDGLA